ncbi:MAG: VCBS repeat-containing protein [Firmicutes bacterium]|nr:VCBS repeat-containing protein [Bacillota bacterium]
MKNFTFKIGLTLIFLTVMGFILVFPLMGADKPSPTPVPDNWCYSLVPGPIAELSFNTQWILIDGQFYAITLDEGQIVICAPDSASNWGETQRLSIPDTSFTVFKVKDINNDNVPELIAGAAEPGFIRIYQQNGGKWATNSNEKYVWTSITNIAVGNFDDPQTSNVLVQNQRGMLYLFKISGNSNALDLIWQSPSVWRAAESFINLDFDQDGKDEIMVSYKDGGIGILKAVNKQIVSIWDNYLWGKILDITTGDWDDDGRPELFLSTSQKIIYILGFNNKTYQFEGQLSQLKYTTEKLYFANVNSEKQLFTMDTGGKTHLLEYYSKSQEWVEQFVCPTGRVAQILGLVPDKNISISLWGVNRQMITVHAMRTKELALNYQGEGYNLTPPAWYQNNQLYLAPSALAKIPGFGLTYTVDKSSFRVEYHETKIVIKRENNNLIAQAGGVREVDCLLINGELYISISGLADLLGVSIQWEPPAKIIQLIEPLEEAPEEEVPQEAADETAETGETVATPTVIPVLTPGATPAVSPPVSIF